MPYHEWDCSIDPEVVPLFLALQRCHTRSLSGVRPLQDQFGLTPAEFDVLASLRNAPTPHRLTPKEIQEEVVITSGGLSKVMLQLEARGHVTRSQLSGDQRYKPVQLTRSGRQCIEKAMEAMVATTGRWMRGALTGKDMAELTRLLGKLADAEAPGK